MKRFGRVPLTTIVLALALAPAVASGQTYTAIGVGITVPTGSFADLYDNGYTVRGQLGLDLLLVDAHVQAGWNRFSGKTTAEPATEDVDLYHAGVGARVGIGVLWIGANAAYFFGDLDNDGLGLFPEAGVGVGPIEFVADYRMDGDLRWFGIRAALKF